MPRRRITVTSTAYSRAAAWVVALAFLAILIFVIVGITRRIRTAQGSRSGSADGDPMTSPSAGAGPPAARPTGSPLTWRGAP